MIQVLTGRGKQQPADQYSQLQKYRDDVGLHITDEPFLDRMEWCEQVV